MRRAIILAFLIAALGGPASADAPPAVGVALERDTENGTELLVTIRNRASRPLCPGPNHDAPTRVRGFKHGAPIQHLSDFEGRPVSTCRWLQPGETLRVTYRLDNLFLLQDRIGARVCYTFIWRAAEASPTRRRTACLAAD